MTKFIKEKFNDDGMYVTYDGKFVARFKYARSGKGSFISFLIKNFTVEEYFAELDKGKAPLQILEAKDYLLPHIKKWLKEAGYPLTQAGFKQYVRDGIAKRMVIQSQL